MAEKTQAKETKKRGWKKPRTNTKKTKDMTNKNNEQNVKAKEQKPVKTSAPKQKRQAGRSTKRKNAPSRNHIFPANTVSTIHSQTGFLVEKNTVAIAASARYGIRAEGSINQIRLLFIIIAP